MNASISQARPVLGVTPLEIVWKRYAENMLIKIYVPEANCMSREEAVKLALVRDQETANQLKADALAVRETELTKELYG